MKRKTCLLPFIVLLMTLQAHAEENLGKIKNMSVSAQGGGFFIPLGPASFGGGLRFEYAFSPLVSLIVPVDYRFVAASGFAESPKFDTVIGGGGARFYFSKLFWPQEMLRGFFAEGHVGIGYAIEHPGDVLGVRQPQKKGLAFALSGALGYAHAFDFGLVLGGNISLTGRAYKSPIEQKGLLAYAPDIMVQIGWAF